MSPPTRVRNRVRISGRAAEESFPAAATTNHPGVFLPDMADQAVKGRSKNDSIKLQSCKSYIGKSQS